MPLPLPKLLRHCCKAAVPLTATSPRRCATAARPYTAYCCAAAAAFLTLRRCCRPLRRCRSAAVAAICTAAELPLSYCRKATATDIVAAAQLPPPLRRTEQNNLGN